MNHAPAPPATALTLADQARVVASLQAALAGSPATSPVTLIETHISFVLMAGAQAYKIKKAVNLGFARLHDAGVAPLLLRRGTAPEPPPGAGAVPGRAADHRHAAAAGARRQRAGRSTGW